MSGEFAQQLDLLLKSAGIPLKQAAVWMGISTAQLWDVLHSDRPPVSVLELRSFGDQAGAFVDDAALQRLMHLALLERTLRVCQGASSDQIAALGRALSELYQVVSATERLLTTVCTDCGAAVTDGKIMLDCVAGRDLLEKSLMLSEAAHLAADPRASNLCNRCLEKRLTTFLQERHSIE